MGKKKIAATLACPGILSVIDDDVLTITTDNDAITFVFDTN